MAQGGNSAYDLWRDSVGRLLRDKDPQFDPADLDPDAMFRAYVSGVSPVIFSNGQLPLKPRPLVQAPDRYVDVDAGNPFSPMPLGGELNNARSSGYGWVLGTLVIIRMLAGFVVAVKAVRDQSSVDMGVLWSLLAFDVVILVGAVLLAGSANAVDKRWGYFFVGAALNGLWIGLAPSIVLMLR